MKIDMSQVLMTCEREPRQLKDVVKVKVKDEETGEETDKETTVEVPITLRQVCVNALMSQLQGDTSDWKEKRERWKLADRLGNEDSPELSHKEIVKIQTLLAKAYGTTICGAAGQFLGD